MTVLYNNADCLLNKRNDLELLAKTSKPHIIGITVVNPKNTRLPVQESELCMQDYECYPSLVGGRGACLYIHNSLTASEVKLSNTTVCDSVWCTVRLSGTDQLLVGCVYRSPNISTDDDVQLNNMLLEASNYKTSHVVVMGDFNHPEIDWLSE